MTLTDIYELKKQALSCKDSNELARLLDDVGEDSDEITAGKMFERLRKSEDGFEWSEEGASLRENVISCPNCNNSSPDKLLSNSAEVLAIGKEVHLGCCECGEMFVF